jgi:two-component system phosphate regulon sensor histidine kinase PhoR
VLAHALVGFIAIRATVGLVRAEERSHAREILDATVTVASLAITPELRRGDLPAIDERLRVLGERARVRLVLHDPAGDLLGRSSRPGAAGPATGTLKEVREAIESGRGESFRQSATSGRGAMHVAVRIEDAGEVLGVIRGELEPETLDQIPARSAGRMVLLALTGLLGVALLTLAAVSRRVDGRIDNLADAARRFAAGDLGHRVDPYESRELSGLASGLNEMAGQLEQRVEQLHAGAAEQRAMLQSMSAGMIALDLDQRVLRSNSRADGLLDIEPSVRVRGRMLQELTRNRALNQLLEDAADADDSIEGDIETRDRIVRVSIEPLVDAERGRLGLLMLLTDITNLRRLEGLRSEFAANVSHELRTPITNIKGYAETLLESAEDDDLSETTRRFLGVIARNAVRLEAIIEDLLALAGLERQSEGEMIDMEGETAARVVSTVVGQFEQPAVDRDIRIATEVEPGLEVVGGVHLIEQAISNLVSNAIRYCDAGTTVTVGARGVDEDTLEFSVTDEGPGIAPEHLERIFERFYRVDHARSRDLGGTGLGLAIVKHVAVAHGGRAEVESEVGRGTRFTIVLPRRSRVARMSSGDPGTARPKGAKKRAREQAAAEAAAAEAERRATDDPAAPSG